MRKHNPNIKNYLVDERGLTEDKMEHYRELWELYDQLLYYPLDPKKTSYVISDKNLEEKERRHLQILPEIVLHHIKQDRDGTFYIQPIYMADILRLYTIEERDIFYSILFHYKRSLAVDYLVDGNENELFWGWLGDSTDANFGWEDHIRIEGWTNLLILPIFDSVPERDIIVNTIVDFIQKRNGEP